MDAIARARELYTRGNHRAAIDLLRPAAEADSTPYEARLALAEIYRDMGCPDQAGRWGIAIDGWTTERERDRLASLLAATGVSDRRVRSFLRIPAEASEPIDLGELISALPVEHRRLRARLRPAPGAPAAERAAGFALVAAVLFGLASVLIMAIGLVGTYLSVLLSAESSPALVQWSAVSALLSGAAALVASAIAVIISRAPGAVWRIVSAGILVLIGLSLSGMFSGIAA
ncbi:hypothetical protein [Agromyces atrinae]|uniref:Tetratricopeptide repeat protein n=1 Tax=Agromyces atrinae TaxID=592376 RepID=A0A4Q2M3J4_9MICO|nr:hypothetical protein [Agromyces atrinae]NYD65503.1 hypothetical protein [Agromyces atrinae]RXZ85767.1 hypothetical protein ESP50_13285 [Agromyces atrinae]